MPFTLKLHADETIGLVATCDVCGKQTTSDTANLLWSPEDIRDEKDAISYRIACRERCTFFVDKKLGHQCSQNLDAALVYLLNNTKVNLTKARRKVQLLAQFR